MTMENHPGFNRKYIWFSIVMLVFWRVYMQLLLGDAPIFH